MALTQGMKTTFTMPSDREVAATRVFDAPRALVWKAFTVPEHVSRWMLGPDGWTMPVCEIDLRPGGEWHYVWRKTNETEMGMRGVFREIVPPERMVNTERWSDEWPETINTTTFTEHDGKTTVVCTVLWPSKEDRDKALTTGMNDGWATSYERLADYLPTID